MNRIKKIISALLVICLFAGMFPLMEANAAEITSSEYNPHTGELYLEFGYQSTQYVNINVYTRSVKDGQLQKQKVGALAENVMLTGAGDIIFFEPEVNSDGMDNPWSAGSWIAPGVTITDDEIYETTVNFAGETIPATKMMKHTLTWNGMLHGAPIIGPNLNEDMFFLTIEIEPLGRPDLNEECIDEDDGEGGTIHTHGKNYTWTQAVDSSGKKTYAISTEIMVDYRQYLYDPGSGTVAYIVVNGSISDRALKEMYEQFESGGITCEMKEELRKNNILLDYDGIDPVDMVTGAYNFTYQDLRLEGAIPLTFMRVYNSRYNGGSLGKGFTHGYDYSLWNDRGIIRVTVPGGEEQIFLTLRGGGYDSLCNSEFTMSNHGGGYRMTHKDGAQFDFSSAGKLTEVRNPDGVAVARLSYTGSKLTGIAGVVGSMTFAWNGDHIESVTDSAGRTVLYEYDGDLLVAVTNPDGDTLRYAYDENGYIASVADFEGDIYVENTYDKTGRVTEQVFTNADVPTVSTISYNDADHITTCTDGSGLVKKYYYDNHRNILRVGTVIDGTEYIAENTYTDSYEANSLSDSENNRTAYEYTNGNVTRINYADGTYASLAYTSNGEISSITDALGHTERYAYSGHSLTSYTDRNGNTTKYTYNALGLPSAMTDPLGNKTTYSYDAAGHLLSVADPAGGVASYDYDAVGRIVASHTKISDIETATTRYEYSPAGKLLKTTDALGNETTYTYNGNGFVTSTTDALGNKTAIEYGTNGQPLKHTDAMGGETVYSYDSNTSQLKSVTDPSGSTTTYTYNDRNLIKTIEDADGNRTRYEYDSLDRVTAVIDALGGRTECEYDSMSRTTKITDAEGAETSYAYDMLGRLKTVTDDAGNSTTYAYDPVGNRVSTTDANGNSARLEYDKMNRAVKVTDAEGNATSYTYDAAGRLVSVTDALGGEVIYTYDLAGNLLSFTDPEGNATRYVYDLLGRTVEQINADNTCTRTVYDELGRVIEQYDELDRQVSYTYDANGNLLAATDRLGNTVERSYDSNNRVTDISYPDGGVLHYVYNSNGRIQSITDRNGNATNYTYDALGRTETVTDAENVVTKYFYDAVGNTVKITRDGQTVSTHEYDSTYRIVSFADGLGSTAAYVYDDVGNILSYTDRNGAVTKHEYDRNYRLVKLTDANGGESSAAYDELGRMIAATDSNGNATTYTYDRNGQVLSVTDALNGTVSYAYDRMGRLISVTDRLGAVTRYEYDSAGRLLTKTEPDSTRISYEYDEEDNLLRYTNHNNEWVKYEYDSMGRCVKETNQLNEATAYEYDLEGNLVTVTDENRNTFAYTYDALNRPISSTTPEGELALYAYDSLENVSSFTAYGGTGRKETTTYAYDAAGNLTKEISPLGHTTTYTYDGEGNVLTRTDESGKVTTYEYDALGQLLSRTDADGTAAYTYDPEGNLTAATNQNGTVSFTYDALNRPVSVANEDMTTTAYTYDAEGNRLSVTYPDGRTVTTSYDLRGNVTAITDWDGTSIAYTRDSEGRVTKAAYPDGSTTEYAYNSAGRLIQQKEMSADNVTNRQISYTYDDAGNLTSENRSGIDIDRHDETVRYYYDHANRLIRTVSEGVAVNYAYDKAGNILSDGEYTYTYDRQNRLLTKQDKNGTTTSYSYDSVGNLVKKTSPDSSVSYTYDAQNRLVRGETSDGESSTYTYNALGVRIANTQVRINENARNRNSDLKDGSHDTDYLDYLADGRETWQRAWETEVGTTVQPDTETVTRRYVVDYLSDAYRDIFVAEEGSYTQRFVYNENGVRVTAEFGYAPNTQRGEGGENLQSDIAVGLGKIWYKNSQIGTAVYAVDSDCKTVSHMIYDVWGEPQRETYTDTNLSGIDALANFTGYTWDEVLDLYFAQNRFYDPADHRFTQEDIVKDSLNWYAYCDNNPTLRVDPWGLETELTAQDVKEMVEWIANVANGNASDFSAYIADSSFSWEKVQKDIKHWVATSGFMSASHKASTVLNYFSEFICPSRFVDMWMNYAVVSQYNSMAKDGSYQYINGQGTGAVANLPFGYSTMAHSGCGVIATYNALVALGDPRPLADVALSYELNGRIIYGMLGTHPEAITDFFEFEPNYNVQAVYRDDVSSYSEFDNYMSSADAAILTYWAGDNIHNVAVVRDEKGGIIVYNERNLDTNETRHMSIQEMLSKKQRTPIVINLIHKIKRTTESVYPEVDSGVSKQNPKGGMIHTVNR